MWNLETGQVIKTLEGHQSLITNLVLSDDGSTLVSAEEWGDTIHLWDPATGENLGVYRAYIYRGEAKGLAISPDGQLIAEGESARGRNPGVVYRRDGLDNNRWLYQLPGENGYRDPVFSPDGQKVVSFFGVTTIAISRAETGELLHKLEVGEDLGEGLAFFPDGQTLAIGTQTGTVQLWDTDTGTLLDTLNNGVRNNYYVSSLVYSPNGQILAMGMYDLKLRFGALIPTVELWDVEQGVLLGTIEDYQGNIIHLEFSPDGGLLATASLDGTMRLWGIPSE
ncbi:MAG: hypothetical protein JXM69_19340 [Anaerolineae bacterium]|nr:hypothetical protein [Anaerolineae bacterium]